jgi:VanZ family protein
MGDSRPAGAARRLSKWLPVVLWAAVIFLFSTDLFSGENTAGIMSPLVQLFFPGLSAEDLALGHFLIRKFGHFTAYFILAMLLMRALTAEPHRPPASRSMMLAILLVTLYAISDEFHQSLVPSRGASVIDVLIDMAGGISGTVCFYALSRRRISPAPALGERSS